MNTLIKRMVPRAEFTNPSVKMAKADFLIEKNMREYRETKDVWKNLAGEIL